MNVDNSLDTLELFPHVGELDMVRRGLHDDLVAVLGDGPGRQYDND